MATVARRIVTAVPSVGASAARTDREPLAAPGTQASTRSAGSWYAGTADPDFAVTCAKSGVGSACLPGAAQTGS